MLATRRLRFREGSGKFLALCATVAVAGCGGGGGNVPVATAAGNATLGAGQRTQASLQRNVKRDGASCNVLYSFKGTPDGASPWGGLTAVKNTLYGSTAGGGSASAGTVFAYTTSGTESLLHDFTGDPDGFSPQSSLLDVGGTLYGTTNNGGEHNDGSVFAITTKGKEHIVYSFAGGSTDGQNPQSTLIKVGGILYGTTSESGLGGGGTVFSVTKSGIEKTVYPPRGGDLLQGRLLRHDGRRRDRKRWNGLQGDAGRHGNGAAQLHRTTRRPAAHWRPARI
jgi:uncharacterized repeat protein (TIGR03803 family)